MTSGSYSSRYPKQKWGGFCLFIAICLTFLRKNMARKLSVDFVGGSKTLYALSMSTITVMLTPFAGWEFLSVITLAFHLSFFVFFFLFFPQMRFHCLCLYVLIYLHSIRVSHFVISILFFAICDLDLIRFSHFVISVLFSRFVHF